MAIVNGSEDIADDDGSNSSTESDSMIDQDGKTIYLTSPEAGE